MRVADLHAFRDVIARLANPEPRTLNPVPGTPNPTVVLVPTRSAGHLLRASIGDAIPVTRDELYAQLHARLAAPPRLLSGVERDVLMHAAARQASAGGELSFRLRPGLIVEMLRFYDQLRRQQQQVTRFEELIGEAVGGADDDRAAVRLRRQTRFLADAFRDYERRVAASGATDEHTLRAQLVAEAARDPARHVVVTVPDWIADADGLFVADFDLLTRIPGLESLDIVSTEAVLRSGFHERLHTWWPGLEEATPGDLTRADVARGFQPSGRGPERPALQIPPGGSPDESWWTHRDREEELVAVVRQLKADERRGDAVPLARTAVVFKHPLPYLYLAAEVFGAAGVPYQASDALPLAAEPTAAALDLVFDAVAANFTRDTLVALLRSPHFAFQHDGADITRETVSALDHALSDARYLGDLDRLQALLDDGRVAVPALHGLLTAIRPLALLAQPHPASAQIHRLIDFWSAHARPSKDDDPFAARERRARAAIVDTLNAMAAAQTAYDDPAWTIDDLAAAARRWIGEQTFAPDAAPDSGRGVHLLDDQAVRFGEFDDITIVGLIEQEWPERPRRNIFYPPSLLKALGWPSEKDRRAAADARFVDLVSSASRRTYAFTFTLDEDSLVTRSAQLDEIPRARLSSVSSMPFDDTLAFVDEALSLEPVTLAPLDDVARAWAEMRIARTSGEAMDFHGTVRGGTGVPVQTVLSTVQGLPSPPRAWSVSALETYLDCPFKFFAQRVLRLEEEPDDDEVMDPRRQGQFVHDVFEKFFAAWKRAGHRAITPANLDAARDLFTTIVDAALDDAHLSEAEAGLERTRLLGSPAAAGLGEAVFRMEAERPLAVVDRLLEHPLNGDFTFATAGGPRTVALKGKADRIDLLEDGTFRVIDYKLGWPPQRGRALQLPIYGLCAQQQLTAERGRPWTLGEAAYIAFKGPRRVVPLFSAGDREKTLADAQQRMADTLDAIARGEFPPTPDDVYRCETCSFATVCRKDYVGDV